MTKKKNKAKYNFAKLFNSPKYGQILITKEDPDGNPSITIRIAPHGIAIKADTQFKPTADGEKVRSDLFDHVDLEKVEEFIGSEMADMIKESMGGDLE